MREIKFRAWDDAKKEMIPDYCILLPNMHFEGYDLTNDYWCRPVAVMQFTGLHDKNGKEIYEGDVMTGPFANGDHRKDKRIKSFNVSVYFHEGAFHFRPHGNVFDGDYRWYPYWHDCEVIGNIYENPELMEGK